MTRKLPSDIECALHFWNSSACELSHSIEALSGNWRSGVRQLIDPHGQQILYEKINVSIVVEQEQACWAEDFLL